MKPWICDQQQRCWRFADNLAGMWAAFPSFFPRISCRYHAIGRFDPFCTRIPRFSVVPMMECPAWPLGGGPTGFALVFAALDLVSYAKPLSTALRYV